MKDAVGISEFQHRMSRNKAVHMFSDSLFREPGAVPATGFAAAPGELRKTCEQLR